MLPSLALVGHEGRATRRADFTHFEFVPGLCDAQQPPSVIYEMWSEEFDYAYDHVPGGVFDLCMHPQSIGRGPRLRMLERLIAHMRSRPGVRFERVGEYADAWRQRNPLATWVPPHAAS